MNQEIDIDKMTSDEWINYRFDLIDAHLAKGLPLEPNPECNQCDVINDYLCFVCECHQIEGQALPAVIAKYPSASEIGVAELAYSYADAMLLIRDIDPAEYGEAV